MTRRRTEHCWPVAHTLNDLLPLIPDPASFEVGSVLRIERLMLPDVHLELMKFIADRFATHGWRVLGHFLERHRGEWYEESGWMFEWTYPRQPIRVAPELGDAARRTLELREGGSIGEVDAHGAAIQVPLPVRFTHPFVCCNCNREFWFELKKQSHFLFARCRTCGIEERVSLKLRNRGQGRPRYQSTKPKTARKEKVRWTDEEERAAIELRKSGRTCREIAEVLGRSRIAVKSFLYSGGIEGTRKRQARRAYLKDVEF